MADIRDQHAPNVSFRQPGRGQLPHEPERILGRGQRVLSANGEHAPTVWVYIHVVGQMTGSRLGQKAVIEACHGRREVVLGRRVVLI